MVHQSELRLLDVSTVDQGQAFRELVDRRTDVVVEDAWGGHFDAGDWDRRIQHLFYVRTVVELLGERPELFAELELSLPESGDAVPDLLDEALWSLDLYLRLQTDDGAVRGGIEASAHPQDDATSWTDDLAVFAYAPDPWSTYVFAGTAALVADVLERYDPERAATYADAAQRAMEWAERQPPEPEHFAAVAEQRSVAAAALLRLTGDDRWHQAFVDSTTLTAGTDPFLSCNQRTKCDAAWIYLSSEPRFTDPALRETLRASFVETAGRILDAADTTSFGWAVENPFVPLVWGLGAGGSPSSIGLLRAHALTGDERYRSAALRSAAVTLGANPTNTVFITGVGQQPVRHPLIVDTMHGGLPVWSGTPVYGYHQVGRLLDDSWVDRDVLGPGGVDPLAAELPYLWQWFDVPTVAMFNEFTVFQSHAEALYAFGALAGAVTTVGTG